MKLFKYLNTFVFNKRYVVDNDGAGTSTKSVDEQLLAMTKNIENRLSKIDGLEKSAGENKKAYDDLTVTIGDVQKQMLALQKMQINRRSAPVRPGDVSVECARHLGAIALTLGVKRGQVKADSCETVIKDVLGIEMKAAVSSSDFELSTEYSAEVLELVSQYGAARKYGTVFPLGAATVKLPRLKTDPAFSLIAMSAAIGEKKPGIEFVAFSSSKWGGLIRIPAEIDADSIVAIGQFIARYCARQLAKLEDLIFFLGNGTAEHDSLKGLCKLVVENSKVAVLAAGKTKFSDVTLAALREMRANPASAVLGTSAYYFHPTFEQCFSGLNTAGDKPYIANGVNGASLDGFPIRWVDTLPAWGKTANAGVVFGLFGDLSYHYLATRGGVRFDTSTEAGFTTDEILVRSIERFSTGLMAPDAIGGIQTAAA